ncbi:MAG: PAS domain-containing protein [Bacteroidales bacterium]|nr:PAS domain-containing protein [Bacteroidales bacterium]
MACNRFRVFIVIRVLLMVVNIILLVYLGIVTHHVISALILGAILAYQIVDLIRFSEQSNRKLSRFFASIRHSDFSSSFSDERLGRTFDELNRSFNEVMTEFRNQRSAREEQFNYLQTVAQHVSMGILCFDSEGKVDMYNPAVRKMFGLNHLRSISDLSAVEPELPGILLSLRSDDRKLIKLIVRDELMQVSAYATEFRMRGNEFTLVSLQDIHAELEEKEIESWQKLIRVLTHEIMNSITPISSLASTVHDIMIEPSEESPRLKSLSQDEVESIQNALSTIRNRSDGLLNFVEIYRNLTRIPKPSFRYFPVAELFDRAEQLLSPRMMEMGITCKCNVQPDELMLTADPDLLDQVIINLILNSMDAVKGRENPEIFLRAYNGQNNRTLIEVKDNGTGIMPDIIDKIFMPFFTSKKNGSGIGLSLSRQIMYLHKGNITVRSKPDEGSVFILTF